MDDKRTEPADEFLRRLGAAIRAAQLYSARHPIIARNVDLLTQALAAIHASQPSTTIGIVGDEIVVGDLPAGRGDTLTDVIARLKAVGIDRVVIERGVSREELITFVHAIASVEPRRNEDTEVCDLPQLAHIRVGRMRIEQRVEANLSDMATIRQLYADAVTAASRIWESASEEQPDVQAARAMIDGLAHAVAQNRPALLALTALKQYDNYTFTHMVNVSILTMGQARGLGIDGPLLREFGVAALMHDIGKVRTPIEILQKPDALTNAEFAIMKRHPVDGAAMLRRTPEIPSLAPVVAFEHHLRLDGTGYPDVSRGSLNLCTMLCSIADVYDAMRSRRQYQRSFPTERILEVLKRNDGCQFDQHLVRRFVQLVGIYPPGNLVRVDTGDIAVVLRTYAADPYRPQVRIVADPRGQRLELPYDVNLWEIEAGQGRPSSITAPLDPTEFEIDPLNVM
jgi:putative nucleotidyltransferase with HDIG domain